MYLRRDRLYLHPNYTLVILAPMPSNPLETVRGLIAAAADERTPENEALAKARAACKLIHEHKLLETTPATSRPAITLDQVTDAIDAASDFVSRFWSEERPQPRRRRRRNRYA